MLRAKAVLCAGLRVILKDEAAGETEEWYYENGLSAYLRDALEGAEAIPADLFVHHVARDTEGMDVALTWLPEGDLVQESYVNLIPTAQGGTHVNGLRTGLTNAIREFCDIRNLLPRGVKLAPEDVWERISYVLSAKLLDRSPYWVVAISAWSSPAFWPVWDAPSACAIAATCPCGASIDPCDG